MANSMLRLGTVGAALAAVLVAAAPAYAAAPSNDTFGGAVPIPAVPFHTTLDVTEATTDADDAEANQICGAPATDASVWYSLTSPTDEVLVADVSDSDYTAGLIVATGAPGSLELVTCGPGAVAFEALAGTTYYLLAFDDQFDGAGNGGLLDLDVFVAPPPPEVDVTVNPTASFNPGTGSATVSGTITCTGDVEFSFVDVQLSQRVGRGVVEGFGSLEVTCDGVARPWSVEVTPFSGTKFAGGKAASVTFSVACGSVFCGVDFEERTVKLSRR